MAGSCCSVSTNGSNGQPGDKRFRNALWAALIINAFMFIVEISASVASGSVSLLADAIDFLGDAANYVISLSVLSLGLAWRARAAWIKGMTMAIFGCAVLVRAGWVLFSGETPEPVTMGVVGGVALVANVAVAAMLFAFRTGDSDMRSVWLCSRNDAIGNVAVMLAAVGVFGTSQAWPDLAVATLMGLLALSSGISVLRHARDDLRSSQTTASNVPV